MPDLSDAGRILGGHVQRVGVAGAQLSVLTPQGRVDVASGLADTSRSMPMQVGTRSQVGSFSKVLTAVLVHQLVDDGHLDLTDLAADVAADAGDPLPGLDGVQVGQLLSMTSGLDWGIWVEKDTVAGALAPQLLLPRRASPGTSFGYTFASTLVAARLVELIRGRPWWRCVKELIAEPLRLSLSADGATRYDDDVAPGHLATQDGWSLIGAADLPGMGPTGTTLRSSAADLCTLVNALCSSESPLLRSASRAALHQAVVPVGASMVADTWCHGPYSRRIEPASASCSGGTSLETADRLHAHGGRWAGGVCDVTWNASTGSSVAIVTNTPGRGAALVLDVGRDIHRMLWGDGAFVDQIECPSVPDRRDLDGLTGRYATANRVYDVRIGGRSLTVTATSLPHPDAVFTLPDMVVELRQVGTRRFLPVNETRDERRLQEFWFSTSAQPGPADYLYDGFVGARRVDASDTTSANAAGS